MEWDSIKHILALSREKTLSAAARQLRVNQTTVARRLAAFEKDLGTRLFDRIDGRFVLTPEGEAFCRRAESIEEDILALEETATGRNATLSGTVRLTAVPGFFVNYLVPRMDSLRRRYPEMSLELIGDPSNRNLSRREADIAIRLARPLKGVAITRKLADMGFAVYGRRDQRTEDDGTAADSEPWATYDDSMANLPEAAWVAKRMDDERATIRTNDDTVLDGIVRGGLGIGLIACYLGDRDPALRRLSGPEPVVSREIWLLVHPDLRRTAQVRSTVDWLVDTVTADRELLAGIQDGA